MTPTDMDKRVAEQSARAQRERSAACVWSDPKASINGKQHATRRSGDRWRAFNSFMDVIAPRLTLAERAVWLVMFRHARNGVVQTSERQLATAADIDKATAGRALRRLTALRLTWPIRKSTNKAMQSQYAIHPNPAACLAAVIVAEVPSAEAIEPHA